MYFALFGTQEKSFLCTLLSFKIDLLLHFSARYNTYTRWYRLGSSILETWLYFLLLLFWPEVDQKFYTTKHVFRSENYEYTEK